MAFRDVKLQWVIVDDQPHQVSEFAGIPTGLRPRASCPLCKQSVILKLGTQRAYHAAHNDGAICAATQPETAIHLNMKYHLLRELSQSKELLITQACSGWQVRTDDYSRYGSCSERRSTVLASDWDDVQVEVRQQGLVFDVALLKNQKVLAAIEVYVTHRVDDEKLKILKQTNTPWVEIQAEETFYGGDTPWTANAPLNPLRAGYPSGIHGWQCPKCVKAEEAARYQARLAGRRATPKNYQITSTLRFVDIYYRSGKHFREVFSLKQKILSNGTVISAWLEKGDYKKAPTQTIRSCQSPITDQTIVDLKQAFHDYLAELREKGSVVDSPMSWHEWPKGLNRGQVFFEFDVFPRRYEFTNNRWVLQKTFTGLSWDGYWENPSAYQYRLFELQRAVSNLSYNQNAAQNRSDSEQQFISDPKEPINRKKKHVEEIPQSSTQSILAPKMGICLLCGRETNEHWFYDGRDGTCKCYECFRKGLS